MCNLVSCPYHRGTWGDVDVPWKLYSLTWADHITYFRCLCALANLVISTTLYRPHVQRKYGEAIVGGTLWNGTSLLEQDPRIFYSLWTQPTPLYEVREGTCLGEEPVFGGTSGFLPTIEAAAKNMHSRFDRSSACVPPASPVGWSGPPLLAPGRPADFGQRRDCAPHQWAAVSEPVCRAMWLGRRQHANGFMAGKVGGQPANKMPKLMHSAPCPEIEAPLWDGFCHWPNNAFFISVYRAFGHYWQGGNSDGSASAGDHDRGPIVITERPTFVQGGPGLGAQLVCVMPRRHADRMVTMHMNCLHAGTKEAGMHWFRNWTVDPGKYDEAVGRNASLAVFPDW